jgi:hypothetical protein
LQSGYLTLSHRYTYPDGCTFEGLWRNGARCDGKGKCRYADGSVFEGEFRLNKRDGHGM